MVTLHPSVKSTSLGFVPMVTLRNDKGHMLGAHTPQGGYREFRTFTNEYDALTEARLIVMRCARKYPDRLKARAF